MIVKLERFLGNTNTLEVHDTRAEVANCQLDEILIAHREWYPTLAAAKAARDFDNCAWCIGGSTR
jgi:hypothetical protein